MTPELEAALKRIQKVYAPAGYWMEDQHNDLKLIREALQQQESVSYVWGVQYPEMGVFRMRSEDDARQNAAGTEGAVAVRKALGPWEDA